jgi:hypothetical protein
LNSSNSLDVTVKDYINDVKKILTDAEYSQYNKQSIVPIETPELPSMDKEMGESTQAIDKKFIPYPPESPPYPPESPEFSPISAPYSPAYVPVSPINIEEVKLSNDSQSPVYRPISFSSNSNDNVTENIQDNQNNKSILEVEEPVDENQANKGEDNIEGQDSSNKDINSENSSNQEKKVIINLDKNETINDDNSNNSKKIIL